MHFFIIFLSMTFMDTARDSFTDSFRVYHFFSRIFFERKVLRIIYGGVQTDAERINRMLDKNAVKMVLEGKRIGTSRCGTQRAKWIDQVEDGRNQSFGLKMSIEHVVFIVKLSVTKFIYFFFVII